MSRSGKSIKPQLDGVRRAVEQAVDGGGGGNNIMQVNNQADGRLLVRGSIKLNQIPGLTVAPQNVAHARAACIDCQTLAGALQINLISRTAQRVTPVTPPLR